MGCSLLIPVPFLSMTRQAVLLRSLPLWKANLPSTKICSSSEGPSPTTKSWIPKKILLLILEQYSFLNSLHYGGELIILHAINYYNTSHLAYFWSSQSMIPEHLPLSRQNLDFTAATGRAQKTITEEEGKTGLTCLVYFNPRAIGHFVNQANKTCFKI